MTNPAAVGPKLSSVLLAALVLFAGVTGRACAEEGGRSTQQAASAMVEPAQPAGLALAERWAASPLLLRSRAQSEATGDPVDGRSRLDDQKRTSIMFVAAGATALLALSLLESLLLAFARSARQLRSRPPTPLSRRATEADHEDKCRSLMRSIGTLWQRAETAVLDLDEALPLRALLFKELKQISQRLSMDPALRPAASGALTTHHEGSYWKSLSQRLNQAARDLSRIGAVAEAASAGFGGRSSDPRIPKNRDEAFFILGANREANAETLQRLVKALRQCWHPDLALTAADRHHREARLKQINAANDLITGKRSEG